MFSSELFHALAMIIGLTLLSLIVGRILSWILWRRIDRNAKRITAQQSGVSYAYVNEVIENNKQLVNGKITSEQWKQNAMQIAYRYPQDSGIREMLIEAETRG